MKADLSRSHLNRRSGAGKGKNWFGSVASDLQSGQRLSSRQRKTPSNEAYIFQFTSDRSPLQSMIWKVTVRNIHLTKSSYSHCRRGQSTSAVFDNCCNGRNRRRLNLPVLHVQKRA